MQSHALVPAFGTTAQGAHLQTPHASHPRFWYRDATTSAARPTIILVHGGFVRGSSWQGVSRVLQDDGYGVRVVRNATTSLADDVAATRRVMDMQNGPVVLVGHSYGGAVITEAGNDPKVVGLVYIAAFVPDKGESVSWLMNDPTPGAPVPPILPARGGFLLLDRTKFAASFAADVDAETAQRMAESQVPWGAGALNGTVTEPAWRKKPSWYLVAADDKMIPARAQWAMAKRARSRVTETGGSHALYVSRPAVVAAIIAKAAHGVAVAATWA